MSRVFYFSNSGMVAHAKQFPGGKSHFNRNLVQPIVQVCVFEEVVIRIPGHPCAVNGAGTIEAAADRTAHQQDVWIMENRNNAEKLYE
jgi:hypothetical protein